MATVHRERSGDGLVVSDAAGTLLPEGKDPDDLLQREVGDMVNGGVIYVQNARSPRLSGK